MQINFTGHHVDVTPALKTLTIEKFRKLERHYDKIIGINVLFKVEKLTQIAEATIFVAKGELYAHAELDDMYTALDELVSKLDRQLIKHKEKQRTYHDDL
jgi:putative sigma-54 modulation protein